MIKTFYSNDWEDYQLLDTGEGKKLERFGKYTFVRPYEDAFWKKTLSKKEWDSADGIFFSSKGGGKGGLASLKKSESGWKIGNKIDPKWEMSHKGIKFWSWPTPFRHLGFFPEQASHWSLIEDKIKNAGRKVKFLNIFGYTGVASLFALRAGADVTHLDASKQTLSVVKENQELSGLSDLPMRIILDDAVKFIDREIKRGNKFDCIIMDPPKFGRGPKGEIWKIEENLPGLLEKIRKILSDKPLFVILTSYATEASSLSIGYALEEMMKGLNGKVEAGELCILEKSNNRAVPLANTAVWIAN
jgi:23S rRNA (cytosine1962-C5)-methyltransferase